MTPEDLLTAITSAILPILPVMIGISTALWGLSFGWRLVSRFVRSESYWDDERDRLTAAEEARIVAQGDEIRKRWTPPPMSNEVARWTVYNAAHPDHTKETDQ